MKRNLQYRLVLIIAVLALSVFFLYPPQEKINLGLDLQGGIHLVLQVRTQEALDAEVNQVRDRIEANLRKENLLFSGIRLTEDREIEILGVPQDQRSPVEDYLREYSGDWSYRPRFGEGEVDFVIEMNRRRERELMNLTVSQAKETIQRRVDQYGVAEPTIVIYGSGEVKDQIIVELPGVDDPDRVIDLIESTAKLELKLVQTGKGRTVWQSRGGARGV